MKGVGRLLLLSAALLLAGCKIDLYSNLSEEDANQMLALLASNQIEGDKRTDKAGGLVLEVEKSDFVKAVEVLRQNGYPRRAYRSVDELFPSGQLVSSPTQEQAKIRFLREQSLERMLSNIEGVISANVVIADKPDSSDSHSEPSASVLVKYSPEVNLRALGVQLKNLIHNALPGVSQDHISLIVQAVDYRFAVTHNAARVEPIAASVKPTPPAAKLEPSTIKSTSPAASSIKSDVSSANSPLPPAASPAPTPTADHVPAQQSINLAALPSWALLLFWLVSCGSIVWHGRRKSRLRQKQDETHLDGN